VSLTDDLYNLQGLKFSFGKSSEFHPTFSREIGAASMYDDNLGLGISQMLSAEYRLRAIFTVITRAEGHFVFNISGVDLQRANAGFTSYDEASDNNMITEWELSILLQNSDYLEKTIFHNGKTRLQQTDRGLEIQWN
jgi:hypothetical protein